MHVALTTPAWYGKLRNWRNYGKKRRNNNRNLIHASPIGRLLTWRSGHMIGKTIQCSNCGGSLDVPEGVNKIFCLYCGNPNLLTDILEIPGLTLLCLKCNTKNKDENIFCECGLMLQYYCQFCSELHPLNKKVCPQKGVKFNVNTTKDKDGKTALQKAIEIGHADTVELLISLGANVNTKDINGCNNLQKAIEKGYTDIVKLLISSGADVNAKDNNRQTPLHQASLNNHTDIVKLLISSGADVNAKDNNGQTPLYREALMCHINTVKLLISLGANVNAKDNNGQTPLHQASLNNHTNIVKLLISSGADVNAKDNNGQTPLHQASLNNHTDIVKLLISSGANVNAKDNNGQTPLHQASLNNHTDIVKLLISSGADVNAKDNNGQTPLHQASLNNHTDIVKLLISSGADVNAKDNNGQTPLHQASLNYHTDTVKLLISLGTNVNAKDNNGQTPLYREALMGHIDTVKLKTIKEEIQILEAELNSINLNPQKEQKQSSCFYVALIPFIFIVTFIGIICIACTISEAQKGSSCGASFGVILGLIFLPLISGYIFRLIWFKIFPPICTDNEQQKINQKKYNTTKSNIKDLKEKENQIQVKTKVIHSDSLKEGDEDSILTEDTHDEFTWLKKGKYWLNKQEYEKAIECFDKALKIYSRLTEALIKKGIALLNLSKHNEALQCFNKALEIHPNSSEAKEYKEQTLKAGR